MIQLVGVRPVFVRYELLIFFFELGRFSPLIGKFFILTLAFEFQADCTPYREPSSA